MANGEDDSPGGGARCSEANLVVAIIVHIVVGGSWFFLVVGVALLFGEGAAGVWVLCGGALWILGAANAVRRRADAGRVWSAILRSWLWMPGGPISLAVVGIQRLGSSGATYEPPRPVTQPLAIESPEEPVNPELERRLDVLGQRIDALSRELVEIRRLAETGAAQAPLEELPGWNRPRVAASAPKRPARTRGPRGGSGLGRAARRPGLAGRRDRDRRGRLLRPAANALIGPPSASLGAIAGVRSAPVSTSTAATAHTPRTAR
jgi:hypothetical protein